MMKVMIGAFVSLLSFPADSVTVDSCDALQSAINSAQPGHTIVVKDGEYAGCHLDVKIKGTPGSPITIKSETMLGVRLPEGRWSLQGAEWIVIDGFYVTDSGVDTEFYLREAKDNVIRNNLMRQNPNQGGTRWVLRIANGSQRNIIEYNEFLNTNGIQIAGWKTDRENTDTIIRGNYFHGLAPGKSDFIQDASSRCAGDGKPFKNRTIIHGNVFEGIANVDELLSLKAGDGVLSFNSFIGPADEVRLRASHNTLVEDNVFINIDSASANGPFHKVRNNYFEDTYFSIGTGNYEFPEHKEGSDGCTSGYIHRWRSEDVVIENNQWRDAYIILNTSWNQRSGRGDVPNATKEARNLTIRNNQFSLKQSEAIRDEDSSQPTQIGNKFDVSGISRPSYLLPKDVGPGKGETGSPKPPPAHDTPVVPSNVKVQVRD